MARRGLKLNCEEWRGWTIESRNFFVLGPILVKFHIRTRLIESFPTAYQSWICAEEKLHFTPVHTICQLKRDEWLFPPLSICLAGWNGLKNLARHIFSACVKFGGNPWRDVETAWPNLSEPVHNTVTMYALHAMLFCTFKGYNSSVLRLILLKLHILTRLIESFPTVYGLWSCIEIEMSIPLGALLRDRR